MVSCECVRVPPSLQHPHNLKDVDSGDEDRLVIDTASSPVEDTAEMDDDLGEQDESLVIDEGPGASPGKESKPGMIPINTPLYDKIEKIYK